MQYGGRKRPGARTLPGITKPFSTAYAFGHFGKSLFWHASELLFAYYLTEICHLTPVAMGFVLSLSLLLNAVCDGIAGQVLARGLSGTAAAAGLQAGGAVLSTGGFLAFAGVAFLPQAWRIGAALVTLSLFRIVYSLYDVPQNAMLAFEAATDRERSQLSALRFIFSGLANLAIAGSFVPWLRPGGHAAPAVHFGMLAMGLSALALLSSGLLWLAGRHRKPGPGVEVAPGTPARPFFVLWPVLLAGLAVSLGTSAFSRLEPYFASFALASPADGAILMTSVSVGTLASQPIWVAICYRLGLERTLGLATLVLSAGAMAIFCISHGGPWPAGLSGFVYGTGFGGVMMSLWAILARGTQGVAQRFGLFTLFSKVGLAISALLTGWAMTRFDYRSDAPALIGIMTALPVAGAVSALLLTTAWRGRKSQAR